MKHGRSLRVISALILAILLASFTSVFVFSADFDYSYESAPLKTEISASDFLNEKLGLVLENAEKQYLNSYSGFLISFNSHIPTTSVSVEYSEADALLIVSASEYTYTASNGVTVVWKPESVSLLGDTKLLSHPAYTAEFTNASSVNSESVDVKYSTEFIIPKQDVTELLNMAYLNAPLHKIEIQEKQEQYENDLAEYQANVLKYAEYTEKLAAYSEYLSQKRIYDEKFAEYSSYLEELDEYKTAKAGYDAYLEAKEKYLSDYALYLKYLAYVSVNQSKVDAYEQYALKLKKAQAQLDIIKGTKRRATSLERSVYGAITGDTVTNVIANKDAIANNITGADPKIVDLAGAATENLRKLYDGFFSITDENEQYNYYVTNYNAFKDNFANLFRALDKLYLNSKVRGILKAQEKQEKYLILLAELYYVTNALSDEPVKNYDGNAYYDSEYIIGKGYIDESTPIKIMEDEEYIADTDDATPISGGYPQSIPKPEFTENMKEPVMPTQPPLPIEPEAVEKPPAPAIVLQPEKVNDPGKAPSEYIPDVVLLQLVEAYEQGLLENRGEHGYDVSIIPNITVTKKFRNIEYVTVNFYDREYTDKENAGVIHTITVDKSSYADFTAQAPTKSEESRYTYSHSGWSDSTGAPLDVSSIASNTDAYPVFSRFEKRFTTVWVVDGDIYTAEPQNPTKPPQGDFCYTFKGWRESWSQSGEELTLTAEFEEKYLLETSYGGVRIEYSDSELKAMVGSHQGPYDIATLIDGAYGMYAIAIQSAKGTVGFSYSETLALKNAGVSTLDFSVLKRIGGDYSYSFRLYDSLGNEISEQIRASVSAPCINDDPARLLLTYRDGEEIKQVKRICDGSDISFTAVSGREYNTRLEYKIAVLALDGVDITIDKTVAKKGESIGVVAEPNPGVRIERIYTINSLGEKQDIKNGTFVMPSDDLTVGVDYVIEEYTVSFVSDGHTLVSFLCRYGDTVTPPADPVKASTDNFSYTFIGWSSDVVPVTESVVYTAVYARRVQKDPNVDTGLQITPSVMRLLILVGVVVAFVLTALTVAVILIIRSVKKRRKLK